MRFVQRAPGGVWLELDGGTAGRQHFAAADLRSIVREFPRGPLSARLAAGQLVVSGAVALLGASPNLELIIEPCVDLAADKAARAAARERAHAAAEWSGLLVGFVPVPPRNAGTLAWLRRTPVEEWPALRVTLNNDGSPILVDGHHRLTAARELGVPELEAEIRTTAGVVRRRVGL